MLNLNIFSIRNFESTFYLFYWILFFIAWKYIFEILLLNYSYIDHKSAWCILLLTICIKNFFHFFTTTLVWSISSPIHIIHIFCHFASKIILTICIPRPQSHFSSYLGKQTNEFFQAKKHFFRSPFRLGFLNKYFLTFSISLKQV